MTDADTRSIRGLGGEGPGKSTSADADLAVGERIGRYLILSRLRAGGMGVVYAAYDPALDRQVAVKLLLREVSGSRADQSFLRAEGRALARLQHGNVVSIYDVGEHDGRVFIAMELVEGQNLSEWLAAGDRSWREIVHVFIRAGRGLEAAHGVGLLHGDFKPSNVMVTDDGAVRVTDFGLARFVDGGGSVPTSDLGQAVGPRGTPGFMAPEILAGGVGDARSDQFSFCIALSQILFGTREVTGTCRSPRPNAAVYGVRSRSPCWVRRVLERGLAEDPTERYSTMGELLHDLWPARRRRRRIMGATLGLVILQGALWVPVWSHWAGLEDTCEARSCFPEEVWGNARAAELEEQFVSMASDQGRRMAGRVTTALDEYAQEWTAVRLDACRSFEEKLESPRLFDLRMDCLDQRLSEVRAVVEVLLKADARTVDLSLDLAFGIRGLARCSDRVELSNLDLPQLDPTQAEEVERWRQEIERAFVGLVTAERVDPVVGQELVARARALGHPLMEARALELIARQLWTRGNVQEARPWMIQALTSALATGDRPLQARLYARLAQIEAKAGADFSQAETWEGLADSAVRPLADAHHEIRIEVDRTLSHVDYEKGDLQAAEARLRRTLAIGEEVWGPNSFRLRSILNDLAVSLGDGEARSDESIELLRRALDIGVATLGADSAYLVPAQVTLSHRLSLRGDHEEAERLARNAVRAAMASPTYSRSPYPPVQLAQVLVARDRPGEALGLLETALALAGESYGEAHPVPIEARTAKGFAELQLLKLSRARETFQAAVDLAEQLPQDHWCARPPRVGLAYVELASGREEDALAIFESLDKHESSNGNDLAPWVKVMLYGGLGESLIGQGRPEEARGYLERAIEEGPSHGDPLLLSRPRFALARLLVDGDREAALVLAKSARSGLAHARSPAHIRLRSEVGAWLRAREEDGGDPVRGTAVSSGSVPGRGGGGPGAAA